jgi:hypothetical protein
MHKSIPLRSDPRLILRVGTASFENRATSILLFEALLRVLGSSSLRLRPPNHHDLCKGDIAMEKTFVMMKESWVKVSPYYFHQCSHGIIDKTGVQRSSSNLGKENYKVDKDRIILGLVGIVTLPLVFATATRRLENFHFSFEHSDHHSSDLIIRS